MYFCSNCGGNLKFNVERQKLFCDFCQTEVDPYDETKVTEALEQVDEYEVSVFTCPQCGGQILSEDTTAATFCSFCGSTTVLEHRISKERRPAYIIPFTKTEEDCKNAYAKMVKKSFFVPKEYKDPNKIKMCRGIYMPYWDYSFSKQGPINITGDKSYRRGNYYYTDTYDIHLNLDMSYSGINFDASSSFYDHLSESIAPFDLRERKEFSPAFLSGFYADTNDVDETVYSNIAQEMVLKDSTKKIKYNKELSKFSIKNSDINNMISSQNQLSKLVMLPVWFLSYRNGERISYAVVNGQTGKVVAELPVDLKKYFLATLLLTILLLIYFNFEFTFTPSILLIFSIILSSICIIIANVQITNLIARDLGKDDLGYMSYIAKQKLDSKQKPDSQKKKSKSSFFVVFFWLMVAIIINIFPFLTIALTLVVLFFKYLKGKKPNKRGIKISDYFKNWKQKILTLIKPLIGLGVCILTFIISPVFDLWYYLSSILGMVLTLFSFIDIIKYHNKLISRKLPQFHKRGGDL